MAQLGNVLGWLGLARSGLSHQAFAEALQECFGALGNLVRLGISHTERANQVSVCSAKREAGEKPYATIDQDGILGEASVSLQVFYNQTLTIEQGGFQ